MTVNVLKGHTLPFEGRFYKYGHLLNGAGSTACSCGARSPVLPSTAARKRWHREHKDMVRIRLWWSAS